MDCSVTSFLSGCSLAVGPQKFICVAKQVDEFAEKDQPNSSFFIHKDGGWGKYKGNVGWPAIAMAIAKPPGQPGSVVAVSPQGDYWEVVASSLAESTGVVSSGRVQLRSLAAIGPAILACGMGRIVLRRDRLGQWKSIGPAPPKAQDKSVIGFEDVDGYSLDEIYAVGWQGEIWRSEKGKWHQIDSPVSANLNAVCCAGDGFVYAVGNGGVMLRGRADVWEVIDTERDENLMDVGLLDKDIFVVTDFRILKLESGILVNDTQFLKPEDRPATCLYLVSAPGSPDWLISLGPKDLFVNEGAGWKRLV